MRNATKASINVNFVVRLFQFIIDTSLKTNGERIFITKLFILYFSQLKLILKYKKKRPILGRFFFIAL